MTSAVVFAYHNVGVRCMRVLRAGWSEGLQTIWDRDILEFFLIGVVVFGLGLLGEYVGRIYQQVRDRPRYVIRAVLERDEEASLPPHPGVESVRLIR